MKPGEKGKLKYKKKLVTQSPNLIDNRVLCSIFCIPAYQIWITADLLRFHTFIFLNILRQRQYGYSS